MLAPVTVQQSRESTSQVCASKVPPLRPRPVPYIMTAEEPDAAAPVGGAFYSLEDEARLQQAKATHRETTASTERSARVRYML